MMNGPATYKAIAEALPWEIRSALLSIRDDELTMNDIPWKIPVQVYIAIFELQLITEDKIGDMLRLSRLGKHLVDYCTC
jgi:hypothetical protein